MTELVTPHIHFVAAPPGTGKTRAAIELMHRHVMGRYDRQHVHYIFYIAPTVDLLKQTLANLKARVPEKLHSKLHIAYMTKLHAIQKINIAKIVDSILDGYDVGGITPAPFKPGCILFLTHEAFIKLRKHQTFSKTLVLFDEARKWSTLFDRFVLTPAVEAAFNTMFKCSPLNVGGKRHPDILRMQANYIPANQMVKKTLGRGATKEEAIAFKHMNELYDALKGIPDGDSVVAPRLKSFAVRQGSGDKRSIVQIALPSEPFRGFHSVFVLSADFKSSQMYFLLLEEGCEPINVTADFMDRFTPGRSYTKALNTIQNRYNHLSVLPLTQDGRALSKMQLASGILVPEEKTQAFLQLLTELEIATGELRHLGRVLADPHSNVVLNPRQQRLVDFMHQHKIQYDVFNWYVTCATTLAAAWMTKHKKPRVTPRPGLLIVNKEQENHPVNPKVFERLSHARAEGRNDFQDCNVVAFFAAVNPQPVLARLLDVLLGSYGYNTDEDHVVDKAIQCIGRGNIRSHTSAEPMLAIVPSVGLANRIIARMSDTPKLLVDEVNRLGNYRTWDGYTASRARAEGRKETTHASKRERDARRDAARSADPLEKELKQKQSLRTYWAKKERDSVGVARAEAAQKVAGLTKEITKLKRKRAELKLASLQ